MDNKLDYKVIERLVSPDATILDLGCGEGELMQYLVDKKDVAAQGIEISESCIYSCVEKGLSVFHGDIEKGLSDYPDKTFDYVILNQSMQQLKNLDFALTESLRVGKQVIIGFPNFAYITARLILFFKGQAPITSTLPYRWYDTPNLHFFSITDFKKYCRSKDIKIIDKSFFNTKKLIKFMPNIFATHAIFRIEK